MKSRVSSLSLFTVLFAASIASAQLYTNGSLSATTTTIVASGLLPGTATSYTSYWFTVEEFVGVTAHSAEALDLPSITSAIDVSSLLAIAGPVSTTPAPSPSSTAASFYVSTKGFVATTAKSAEALELPSAVKQSANVPQASPSTSDSGATAPAAGDNTPVSAQGSPAVSLEAAISKTTQSPTANIGGVIASVLGLTSPAQIQSTASAQAPAAATPAAVSVGGSIVSIQAIQPSPAAVADSTGGSEDNGQASPNSAVFAIGTQTASLGETITAGNTPIAIVTDSVGNTVAVVGSSTAATVASIPADSSAAALQQTGSVTPDVSGGDSADTFSPKPPVALQTTDLVTPGVAGPTQNAELSQASSSAAAGQAYIISSQTLALSSPITIGSGSSASVVSLVTDSAGSTNIVVGSSSTPLSAYLASNTDVQAVSLPTASPAAQAFLVSSQTLALSSPITIGSGSTASVVSLATDAAGSTNVIIGSSTVPLSAYLAANTDIKAINAPTTSPLAQAFLVSSQTLALSSPVTIGSGSSASVISLATDSAGSTDVIIGTSTIPLSAYLASNTDVQAITTTPSAAQAFLVSSQTLAISHPITIGSGSSATVISLTTDAAGSTDVVVGSSTIPLSAYLASNTGVQAINTPSAAQKAIVVAGITISAAPANPTEPFGAVVIGSLTITPGETVTEGSGASAETIVVSDVFGPGGSVTAIAVYVSAGKTSFNGALPTSFFPSSLSGSSSKEGPSKTTQSSRSGSLSSSNTGSTTLATSTGGSVTADAPSPAKTSSNSRGATLQVLSMSGCFIVALGLIVAL